MSFGKNRFHTNAIELYRFANKLNTIVIGGASKLFKHFLKNNNQNNNLNIISYASRDWSTNNTLYNQLGFKFEKNTNIGYWWSKDNYIKYNRFKFRKSKLITNGFDKNKTEIEIMKERGFFRIFNTGNKKYIFMNNKN
jgi:hypothetical protein